MARKAKIRDGRKVTAPVVRLDVHLATEADAAATEVKRTMGTRFSLRGSATGPSDSSAKRDRPQVEPAVALVVGCGTATTRLLVIGTFHYLGDGDLHSSSLVCKAWLKTAFDPALWDYEEGTTEARLL